MNCFKRLFQSFDSSQKSSKNVTEEIKQEIPHMNIRKDLLPSNCYGSNTITNEGAVIHYYSAINVDRDNAFDYETNRKLMLDLNREHDDREWFKMPDYKPRMYASYHYMIPREGDPVQLVPTDKRAYHAGKSEINGRDNLNNWTIGITMLATHTSGFTESQYKWGSEICKIHELDNTQVWGHDEVAPDRKKDPGPEFDWEKFKNLIG